MSAHFRWMAWSWRGVHPRMVSTVFKVPIRLLWTWLSGHFQPPEWFVLMVAREGVTGEGQFIYLWKGKTKTALIHWPGYPALSLYGTLYLHVIIVRNTQHCSATTCAKGHYDVLVTPSQCIYHCAPNFSTNEYWCGLKYMTYFFNVLLSWSDLYVV